MNPSRESIYVALANLVFTDPRVDPAQGGIFKTTGRLLRTYAQVPAGSAGCPAIYLVEHPGENHVRVGKGISDKRTLRCAFVMYFFTADPNNLLPATACNTGLDVIDDVININPNPANTQTLGGLVEHVYIEGELPVAEGLEQEFSVVAVPITILIP